MDGIRAYWTSSELLSRQGRSIPTPQWFIRDLPKIQLDGELWMGRGTFEQLLTVINGQDIISSHWKNIGYYLFDLPSSNAPYEQRLNQLEQLKKSLPHHIQIIESIECSGRKHLDGHLDSILEQGGEGIMAREPGSRYNGGMSTSTLLKVKV